MKKIAKILLCMLLIFCMMLGACDTSSDNGDNGDETVARRTKEKTEESTTAAPTVDAPSTTVDLVAKIEDSNKSLPVGRLVGDKAYKVTVEGVDVYLDYQAWPTLARDENGNMYAIASLRINHVDPFGCTVFYTSTDGGKTWSKPRVINDTPLDDRDTGLVYIGNGKMVASFFTHGAEAYITGKYSESGWENITKEQKAAKLAEWKKLSDVEKVGGYYVMTSDDYGQTWSKPISVPFSCPHGPSVMNDGKTLICSGISSGDVFTMYTSRDFGKTWSKRSEVSLPGLPAEYKYSEPYVMQLSDGSFLAGIRSGIGGSSDGSILRIWTMKSQDGMTWERATEIDSVVGAPAHFLELSNGAILLTYSYRMGHRGIRGCLSYDGGKTWTKNLIAISDNISDNDDVGYPSTVELDDGTLITVYYQPYQKDAQASLLYTKWKLVEAE